MSLFKKWQAAEPVRLYLYGLVAPFLALAVVYGLLDARQVAVWAALAAAVLVPGAELARAKVWPPASYHGRHVRAVEPIDQVDSADQAAEAP